MADEGGGGAGAGVEGDGGRRVDRTEVSPDSSDDDEFEQENTQERVEREARMERLRRPVKKVVTKRRRTEDMPESLIEPPSVPQDDGADVSCVCVCVCV